MNERITSTDPDVSDDRVPDALFDAHYEARENVITLYRTVWNWLS
ncbi:hypothetical protein [Ferroacidibacillus organovorans]|nr:hypothetical protein [Ferroacidibacillus organovorans]